MYASQWRCLSKKGYGSLSLWYTIFFYILLSPLHWPDSHMLNSIIIENVRNILKEWSSFSSPCGGVFVVFSSLNIQQKELPEDNTSTLTHAMLEYILHNSVIRAKHCAPAFHLHLYEIRAWAFVGHTPLCAEWMRRWRRPSPLRSVGGLSWSELYEAFIHNFINYANVGLIGASSARSLGGRSHYEA